MYVIGTERHESRRIDNQLRGRTGRQGDPGTSKFLLSLQDDLMRIFGSERLETMLGKLGLEKGEAIVHPWINKAVEKAQAKVEAHNFEIRKQLLKFDDVMNDQRKVIFDQRKDIMRSDNINAMITDMRHEVIETIVYQSIPNQSYHDEWDAENLSADVKNYLGLTVPIDQWVREDGIIEKLNKIYIGPIGFEYVNIRDTDEVNWIKKWVEEQWYNQNLDRPKQESILKKLNEAVVFENFLHTKYIGQKRFSLEGGENTITFLNEFIKSACNDNVKEVVIGMAHRGRLNVLTSILQKTYDEIFNEFEGNMDPELIFGDGDVKYHLGYNSYINENGKNIYVKLIPNPSHLESVNPVVMGYTRAQIDEEYEGDFNSAIPILIHGDAAIAGQGIVYETIQMSKLDGYKVGGVIHLSLIHI
mgnify:CR=1 FL=1